jgi:putative transposase
VRYAFFREHEDQYPVRRLCKVMAVHPSGYYAWRINPHSKRKIEDQRLLGHIKQSWLESGTVYGYRKVHDDLRELSETCGHNRVYRLMRHASIRSRPVTTADLDIAAVRLLSLHPTGCSNSSMWQSQTGYR